jgi:predicted Fe-Mo cluster-binding NifX family protein
MAERIAFTVVNNSGLGAPMDPRFGRAPHFLIVQEGRVIATLRNSAMGAAHGAGTGAAALMAAHGVGRVVSGHFGPKAADSLTGLGIAMQIAPAGLSAAEALEGLARGELQSQQLRTIR